MYCIVFENLQNCLLLLIVVEFFVPKINEIFMKLSLMKFLWKIQTLCAQMTSTVTFFAAIFQLISLADVR